MTERSAISILLDQFDVASYAKQRADEVRRGARKSINKGHGRVHDSKSIAGMLRKMRVGDELYLPDRKTHNSTNLWREIVGKFRSTQTGSGVTVTRIA